MPNLATVVKLEFRQAAPAVAKPMADAGLAVTLLRGQLSRAIRQARESRGLIRPETLTGALPALDDIADLVAAQEAELLELRQRTARYEAALRHVAERAFASRDWRFAVCVLNGMSIDAAIVATHDQ